MVEPGALTQTGSMSAWRKGCSNENRDDRSLRCDTSALGSSKRLPRNYSLVLAALCFAQSLLCFQLEEQQIRSPNFDLEPETRACYICILPEMVEQE
jgi:hypothetical protein